MPTLNCPRCMQRLTVSDAAPRRLVCPTCLSTIENSSSSAPATASSPAVAPRPVITLDHQVARDTRVIKAIAIVVSAMLAAGVVFIFVATADRWPPYYWLLLMPGIFAAAAVFVLVFTRAPLDEQIREAALYQQAAHYGLPPSDYRPTAAHFTGGAVIAAAACFGLLIFEMAYSQAHSFQPSVPQRVLVWSIVLGVFALLLALATWRGKTNSEWGWLAGVLAGLCIGVLPLGFCGMIAGLTTS